WTSFVGVANGMDLFAQRYASSTQPLPTPNAPYVVVLSSNTISLSWAAVAGFNVANYDVYADGVVTPTAIVSNNWWTMTGLAASSSHTFKIDYVLTDGRRSPLSPSASA